MAVPMPVGMYDWFTPDFGKGPGTGGPDAVGPLYTAAHHICTPAAIIADIAAADANNMVLVAMMATSYPNWTDLRAGKYIFNRTKYVNIVNQFKSTADGGLLSPADFVTLTDAFRRRRLIVMTCDEPNQAYFGGSMPFDVQNELGLIYKAIWPGVITCQRTPAYKMTPAPPGGWTGLDYGMSSWAGRTSGIQQRGTIKEYYDGERALFATIDVGMIPGINWPSGGMVQTTPNMPPLCWDYLNTGSSSGQIVGTGEIGPYTTGQTLACGTADPLCHRFTMSPELIRLAIDSVFDDADSPLFLIWPHARSNFVSEFVPFEKRSDFVAAFDYVLTKAATRPTSTGWRPAKGAPDTGGGGGGGGVPTAVNYAYAEKTTRQTTTSNSYVDVTGCTILNTDLIAGHQYLVYCTGQFDYATAGTSCLIRAMHGATAFPGSEYQWRPSSGAARIAYPFWTVWTAIAGEDLKLQMRNEAGQSKTLGADQVVLFALDLTALPAGSFQYNERAVSDALNGVYLDGGAITFTPAVAGHDWLILSLAHYAGMSITQSVFSQLSRSGEAVATDPQTQLEARTATNTPILSMAKVLSLGNASNTFKEQSKNGGGGGPRDHSKVLALDLNQFAVHQFAYATAELDYINSVTTPWGTQGQTKSITPSTATAPVWVLASHNFVPLAGNYAIQSRLQVDNADAPASQTADNYFLMTNADATDIIPIQHQVVQTLTNVAHACDLDASLNATSGAGKGGRERLVVAIQLAATSTPPTWTAIPDKNVEAETLLDFVVVASDAVVTEPNLVYSVVGSLPNGAVFDPLLRRFRWTPRPLQIDPETPYSIVLRVSNGTTSTDISFLITVVGVQPVETPYDSIRNLRYDASMQAGRIMVSVSWDTGGTLLAGLLKHGITGVVVEMTDMNRVQ